MKKILAITLFFMLTLFFGVSLFMPNSFTITRIIKIHTNNHAVKRLLAEPHYIKKILTLNNNLPVSEGINTFLFKKTEFEIRNMTDNSFSSSAKSESKIIRGTIFLYKIASDSCVVSWTCKQPVTNFFSKLFDYQKAKQLSTIMDELLLIVKQYAENNQFVYGYKIKTDTLTNNIIITCISNTNETNKYTQLQMNFKQINDYISKHNLQISGNYMSNIRAQSADKVTVMTGIPANQFSKPDQQISYMQMPPGGKMVTAVYTGQYKEKEMVYDAMEKYIADNEFKIVSLPYEKYLDNKIPINDSSIVRLKFYYPVF